MGLALDLCQVVNSLKFANWRLGEVLALRHRIVGECLRLLRLVLTLVELGVLEELAAVRSCDLLGTALVTLAGQLLWWLVVFASCLA